MGILDDAIREHLELKRQHGVPEEELRRQEEEALGPARREVAPAGAGNGDGELVAEEAPVAAEPEAAEPEAADEAATGPTPPELHEQETALREPEEAGAADVFPAGPPASGEPVEPHLHEAEPPASEPPADEPEAVPYDESTDLASLDEPIPTGDTPAHGLEALDDDELEPADDVLEDTPDFLQETPEHDRLWFEQKPPRDFDFD